MPPKVSCVILAVNEAEKIVHAISSARRCPFIDEILVFDSGSTDDTLTLARLHADRVEQQAWVDFSTNRQKIIGAARNDWVLILDADEEISESLRDEIAAMPESAFTDHPILTMPRRNYIFRRHVRAWDPDRIARLMDRRRVTWPQRAIHDRPRATSGSVCDLKQPILHNRHTDSWSDYFDGPRYAKRADALAREMFDAGKRVGYFGLKFRPWAAYFKFLILKGGILDGTFGLLIAQKAAVSVQLKYARLWHLQQQSAKRK